MSSKKISRQLQQELRGKIKRNIGELKKKEWNYMTLIPNTTAICQPIDISIGRSIKAKIRDQFENWLIDQFDFLVSYN